MCAHNLQGDRCHQQQGYFHCECDQALGNFCCIETSLPVYIYRVFVGERERENEWELKSAARCIRTGHVIIYYNIVYTSSMCRPYRATFAGESPLL